MRHDPIIEWVRRTAVIAGLIVVLGGAACGLPGAHEGGTSAGGSGRVAVVWMLDGAPLSAQTCQSERIRFMEVDVRSTAGQGAIGFTQVQCDLDRYSLAMTPLGRVVIGVRAIALDSQQRKCLRFYGEAAATAMTAYPEMPARVELKAVNACR